MKAPVQALRFDWYGFPVSVDYCPDYSAAYKDVQGQALYHIEIRGDQGRPLPMSETGYRSAFVASSVIEAWGGVEAYVRGWLNLDYCCPREREEPEQFSLF
jgi:hypothetical protein